MITSVGRAVAGATGALGAAAAVTAYPQVAALAGVSAASLLAAALTRRPRLDLQCAWARPRATEGDDVQLVVQVSNPARSPAAPVYVLPRLDRAPSDLTLAVPSLPGGARRDDVLTVRGLGRGRHRVTALHAERLDPLGLVRHQITAPTDTAVTMHPRTVPLVFPRHSADRADDGPTTDAGRRGDGVFHSLREYQPGDDHRLIHWPSTASCGTVMVRDVIIPEVEQHLVLLDTDPGAYSDGLFDEAVRIAASVALTVSRRHPTWLRLTSGTLLPCPPRQREAQLTMLDRLAACQPEPGAGGCGPREVQGAVVTVVTGNTGSGAGRDAGNRLDRSWGRLDYAASVHLVQTAPGQGRHGPRRGGLSIRTPDLDDFAARWNAWWRW